MNRRLGQEQPLALGGGTLDRVLDHACRALDGDRLQIRDDRGGGDEARLELVAKLELLRLGGVGGQLGQGVVIDARGLLVSPLGVQGVPQLEGQLTAPAGVGGPGHRLSEVLGGSCLAERGLGGAELCEYLGPQLGGRRLLEGALEVAHGRLWGPGLTRGGPELLDGPGIGAGVAQQQVRGDQLDVLAVDVEEPGRVEVPAAAIERRDVLGDRVLDERVDVAQRLAGEQHLDSGQGVGGRAGRVDRQPGECRGAPQGDVGPEDGHSAGQRGGIGPQPADADPQRAGHRARGQRLSASGQLGAGGARVLGQREQQLAQIEGVTAGDLE